MLWYWILVKFLDFINLFPSFSFFGKYLWHPPAHAPVMNDLYQFNTEEWSLELQQINKTSVMTHNITTYQDLKLSFISRFKNDTYFVLQLL